MGSDPSSPIHILFFPLMSPGHFIPMIDMARIFSSHGVRSTIVTTPSNASKIPKSVSSSSTTTVLTIPFPDSSVTGLPAGQECLSNLPASAFDEFVAALQLFRSPLESILSDARPDAIVSDSLFTWSAELATQLGIPRLIFHGAGAFPLYVTMNIFAHFPIDESKDSFLMEGLPAGKKIRLYGKGLPDLFQNIPFLMKMGEAEAKSYGVVINTCREMEPAYVDFLKSIKKIWCVGPVSLVNKAAEEKALRGDAPAAAKEKILNWLDSRPDESVVYVCFGSLCHFSPRQLKEIALGLESSGKNFIWVVRKEAEGDDADEKEWMPEGYEERVGDRGLVVKGWAPQTVILEHRAVGWFVTHCGWNSLQEAACAGVAMVTWPLFHEQFINAELVVETMGVGVRMWEDGFRRCGFTEKEDVMVKAEEIAAAVGKVLSGAQEYEEMKRKAKEYGAAASKALDEGGSSYEDIEALIQELKAKQSSS